MLTQKVIKAYDVRGVYGRDWDAAGAGLLARAFIEKFSIKILVLGWDMRNSCSEIVAEIESAAHAAGICLVKVGRVTTPQLYFATAHYGEHDGGIMVTASHNTGEYNGLKLLLGDGMPVGEASGLPEIAARALVVQAGDEKFGAAGAAGLVRELDIQPAYFAKLFSLINLDSHKPIKVMVDCGNGMAGVTIKKLLSECGSAVDCTEILYSELDGNFPNHEANPLKEETLVELKKRVVTAGAALGAAYDGDGDRIGFVDENGQAVSGDVMIGIVGRELLKAWPGATILYDLRSRRAVVRALAAAGGQPAMCRVGHAFIKKQLREEGALFAGELSSHFYFKDFFGVECADLMLLMVVALLQTSGKKLSELAAEFLVDAHSGEINFTVSNRDFILQKLESEFVGVAKSVSHFDGLLVDLGDWWFNVRPSNTEPLLRLNVEASNAGELAQHLEQLKKIISS